MSAWICILVATTVGLYACVSPAGQIDSQATQYGFTRQVLSGDPFLHIAYKNVAEKNKSRTLHVYLEGDGLPWVSQYRISADPTPRKPLMLELMSMDDMPSIYLGRPCYHGLANTAPCGPVHWTYQRYSNRIVASMAAALMQFTETVEYDRLVLFGFSGGGTLAMLLAERFTTTRAVITIAANLDTDAWSAYHGYSPLEGSLNPSRRAPLNNRIQQLHLAGADDTQVPSEMIAAAAEQQPGADFVLIEGYDHACCWRDIWPQVLHAVQYNSMHTLSKELSREPH